MYVDEEGEEERRRELGAKGRRTKLGFAFFSIFHFRVSKGEHLGKVSSTSLGAASLTQPSQPRSPITLAHQRSFYLNTASSVPFRRAPYLSFMLLRTVLEPIQDALFLTQRICHGPHSFKGGT